MIVVGPEPEPEPEASGNRPKHRAARVVDVDDYRYLPDPDDPDDLDGWSAESGLRDDPVGYGHEFAEDLRDLVSDVMDSAARWTDRYDITFAWTLDGSEQAMHEVAAAVGITLPDHAPGA